MGLLDFISKRPASDRQGNLPIKTSAYNATVAQQAPIRGKYPVAGNGANILEQFQKSHPNLTSAPRYSPQPVPRLRNDTGSLYSDHADRPSTAPSNRPDATRPAPSATSQNSRKQYGPYRLPPKVATDIRTASLVSKPAPSPGLVPEHNGSIRSHDSGKTKNYVDLLDAQSSFKPADFYGRVQATGARNYGEDVADRNIEEKDGGPGAYKTPASYARSPAMRSTPVLTREVDDVSAEPVREPKVRRSAGSGLRSKFASPQPSSAQYPLRTSSHYPPQQHRSAYVDEFGNPMSRTASAREERAARRRSEISVKDDTSRRSSMASRKGKEKEPESFPDDLRDRARATAAQGREVTKPNSSTKRRSLASTHTAETRPRHARNESEQTLPDRPKSSGPQSSRRRSYTQGQSKDMRTPAKRQSLQTMRSSRLGEVYDDTYQHRTSLHGSQQFSSPRERNSRNPPRRQLGSTTDLPDFLPNYYDLPPAAQQPEHHSQVTSTPTDRRSVMMATGESGHSRRQSILSISNKSITAHDIETSIPERTSSLGRVSFTASETAVSTLSSNFFRPQSGHTANTSVDIPVSLFSKFDSSIPPVPDIPPGMSTRPGSSNAPSLYSTTRSIAAFHKSQLSTEFTIDESSLDGHSDRSSSPSRGSYEKDLLFLDSGYGMSGSQLPGLPSPFDAAVPASMDSSTRDLTLKNDSNHDISRVSHFQMPAYLYSDYDSSEAQQQHQNLGMSAADDDDDDDEDDFNFDIPTQRRPDSGRRYAYGA